jgi:type II secretory ATPase GspE/PulE/Tfp pilus assembly ATPase PilB-like protein
LPLGENELNYNVLARFETAGINYERLRKRSPQGCSKCNNTGYTSRTVVAEVIIPDDNFMDLVKKDQKTEAEKYWLNHLNGRNMIEHMVDRLKAGEVDPTDAERVVGPILLPKRGG